MANNVDVFVVPMANPDGYEFSRLHARFWRKNRRQANKSSTCIGVDLNRNWNFHFGEGASDEPCSEVFQGPEPFSEPETDALRRAMADIEGNLHLVLSLHSYGQLIIYPWGYTKTEDPPNRKELVREGNAFVKAISDYSNNNYRLINAAKDMYAASGATDDYALGVLGARFSSTAELREGGVAGFDLDPKEIIPCSDEVWQGLKVLLERIF